MLIKILAEIITSSQFKMEIEMKKIVIIILVLLAAFMVHAAPKFNKQSFYEKKLIVCFQEDVVKNDDGKIITTKNNSFVCTGISKFDQIAAEHEITELEQVFPNVKNKDWRSVKGSGLQFVYRLTLNSNERIESVLFDLEASGLLHYVEYEAIMRYSYTPNDPMFNEQWYHQVIQSEAAWDYINNDEEVLVAISDSGVKWNHPDLQDNIWVNEAELDETMTINWASGAISGGNGIDDDGNGYIDDVIGWSFMAGEEGNSSFQSFNANGHGTHVAGCAGAVADNNEGVVGPFGPFSNIKIIPIRHASTVQPSQQVSNGASGIIYAADVGADIVNCSWGGDGNAELYNQVVDYATDAGTLVVAAAGNNNNEHSPSGQDYPGDSENALCVAATDNNDMKASFSDYGETIDISCPGVNILSTVIRDQDFNLNSYMAADGTSMAAPIVSGVAAMVKAKNPDFTPAEIKQALMETADNIESVNPAYAGLMGAGRINSFAALMYGKVPDISVYAYNLDEVNPENGTNDPGELLSLSIALENTINWLDAEDITITLISESSDIEIIQSELSLSQLANGEFSWIDENSFQLHYNDESLTSLPLTLAITANQNQNIPYQTEIDLVIELSFQQAGWPLTLSEAIESSPLIFDLDGDGYKEIIYGDANGNIQVKMFNGTNAAGFPLNISSDPIKSAITAGDLNNDSFPELIVTTWQDGVFAIDNNGEILYNLSVSGFVASNPVVSDINGDGNLEIIVSSLTGTLAVFDNSGNCMANFPANLTAGSFSPLAIADLNNDDIDDFVISLTNGDLVAISGIDGIMLPGFPYDANSPSEKGPIIADIDGDELPEIICANNSNSVFALNHDGSVIFNNNFGTIKTSVVVAQINESNNPDIIFINEDGELYLLDNLGNIQTGFPIYIDAEVTATPVLANLDSETGYNIIFGDSNGELHAIGADGLEADGFPLLIGNSISISSALGDCDNDGDLEIVVVDENNFNLVDYKFPSDIIWPCFRGNAGRTGNQPVHFTSAPNTQINIPELSSIGNYPNPFNPTTTITFYLKKADKVNLDIYNMKGQKVKSLISEQLTSGTHSTVWNGVNDNNNEVSSGIYFYKVKTSRYTSVKKMILMK